MFASLRLISFCVLSRLLMAGRAVFGAEETNALPGISTNEPIATVRWISGTPAIFRTNRWISLQIGEVIPAGATVRTGAGESLEVILDEPGHLIALGAQSTAVIDLRTASIQLEGGELIASIRKTRKENTTVIIRSRFGESAVRAADLRVTINPAPTLAVLSGAVQFAPARGAGGATALLTAGSMVVATSDNPVLDLMNASLRSYLIGRIDALVSFTGPLAQRFSSHNDAMACHTPPKPELVDPEPRPGRGGGWSYGDEGPVSFEPTTLVEDGTVQRIPGASGCPVHGREWRLAAPKTRAQLIPPPSRRARRTNVELLETNLPATAAP